MAHHHIHRIRDGPGRKRWVGEISEIFQRFLPRHKNAFFDVPAEIFWVAKRNFATPIPGLGMDIGTHHVHSSTELSIRDFDLGSKFLFFQIQNTEYYNW